MISVLAKKYARAFYVTHKEGLTSTLVANIENSLKKLRANKPALAFLHLVPGASEMMPVLDRFLGYCGLDHFFYDLLVVLAQHKRLWLTLEILEELCNLYREQQGIIECSVWSAALLTPDQKNIIHDYLIKKFGDAVEIRYHLDQKLIAGIRIATQELLWEHSVDDQLRKTIRSLGVVYRGN